ncbi:MAG TPA: cache domain-containing protein [Myxococcales bacterium]|nr:cache domain-containing protein [Myxococcales bacterium]
MRTAIVLSLILASAAQAAPSDAAIDSHLAAIKDWDKPTKEQMVTLVKAAADYIAAHGKDAAFKEFQTRPGKFNKGELYIYAYDMNCVVLAHGIKTMLVGKNLGDITDKNGLKPNQALRDAARSGGGFVEFYWENPLTKKQQKKLGYAMKIDETYYIGSGIYLDE